MIVVLIKKLSGWCTDIIPGSGMLDSCCDGQPGTVCSQAAVTDP